MDGVKNGGESDADCGGTSACPRCPDFRLCTLPTDCATNMCTMGLCGSTGCKTFGNTGASPGYLGCERTVPVNTMPCDDIRLTGTVAPVSDDSYGTVALPFTFNFFGTARTSVLINSSGTITFNSLSTSTSNSCLPYSSYAMLAAYWEHLHSGNRVYTQTTGVAPNRKFQILWDTTQYLGGVTRLDFRVVLYEGSNNIDVCYVNTTSGSVTYDSGYTQTAGIQSGAGLATGTLQYSCNMQKLTNGLVLSYMAQ
jgi:hypothetical protein